MWFERRRVADRIGGRDIGDERRQPLELERAAERPRGVARGHVGTQHRQAVVRLGRIITGLERDHAARRQKCELLDDGADRLGTDDQRRAQAQGLHLAAPREACRDGLDEQLGQPVDTRRAWRVVFVDRQIERRLVARTEALGGARGGQHDLADAEFMGRVQHVPAALHVGLEIGLFGRRHAVVDRRQMDHRVVAGERRGDRVEVEHVHRGIGDAGGRRRDVEHRDLGMASEFLDDIAPEAPTAAGHRDAIELHGRSSLSVPRPL